MHYAQFKQADTALLQCLIEIFPFAVIAINGQERPMIAQAPLTFRSKPGLPGMVDFHLARQNGVADAISKGTPATIVVNGPSAHVSPSWYRARFPSSSADRSKTAPTYNYVSATLAGRLCRLGDSDLRQQIADLVNRHEPADGWRFEEIDPAVFDTWRNLLVGYRMEIESFDLTVKISQEQKAEDRPSIAEGLRHRGEYADMAMARLVEGFDGTAASIEAALRTLTHSR